MIYVLVELLTRISNCQHKIWTWRLRQERIFQENIIRTSNFNSSLQNSIDVPPPGRQPTNYKLITMARTMNLNATPALTMGVRIVPLVSGSASMALKGSVAPARITISIIHTSASGGFGSCRIGWGRGLWISEQDRILYPIHVIYSLIKLYELLECLSTSMFTSFLMFDDDALGLLWHFFLLLYRIQLKFYYYV